MKEAHERYTAKMLRKIEAHRKGKRTKVTIPNYKADKEKNRQFITLSGFDLWGDPKGKSRGKPEQE